MVDSLEDELIDLESLIGLEGQAHHLEGVGETLNANTNRSVAHVGITSFDNGVEVAINDLVQVLGNTLSDAMEGLVVERLGFKASELGQGNGGQVANSDFILGGVFKDLSAEVGALDAAEVLLVALAVASILVQHVWGASLDLRINDLLPKPSSFDLLHGATFLLILSVHGLELLTPDLVESWALVGAHQGPLLVSLHSLHEQIWDPKSVEEISSTVLLSSVVLTELKELVDIGVPWLEIDGECALAFAATLVDVASGIVVDLEHGHKTIGIAVRSTDV